MMYHAANISANLHHSTWLPHEQRANTDFLVRTMVPLTQGQFGHRPVTDLLCFDQLGVCCRTCAEQFEAMLCPWAMPQKGHQLEQRFSATSEEARA
jgi:hypothetical protein